MIMTRETQKMVEPLHPAEGCVEFPLLLLDEQLAELEGEAKSAQRTIGQMIRQALGDYLAGASKECGAGGLGAFQPELVLDGSRVLAVTLLLPGSRLAELEALADQFETTVSVLIRRAVCCCLLPLSPNQPPRNES
jgi:hypothetical protein